MSRGLGSAIILPLAAMLLVSCDRPQSMLAPRGEPATQINGLWLLMLVLGTLVWVLVSAAVVTAFLRRRPPREDQPKDRGVSGQRRECARRR